MVRILLKIVKEEKKINKQKGVGGSSSKNGKAQNDTSNFERFDDVDEPTQEQEQEHEELFDNQKMPMRADEMHKFSDGTLNKVYNKLDLMLRDNREIMGEGCVRRWSEEGLSTKRRRTREVVFKNSKGGEGDWLLWRGVEYKVGFGEIWIASMGSVRTLIMDEAHATRLRLDIKNLGFVEATGYSGVEMGEDNYGLHYEITQN
nr:hypothetical protein [Tanacetum cinerariifolium]